MDAIAPIPPVSGLEQAAPSPSLDRLQNRFSDLLAQEASREPLSVVGEPNLLYDVVGQQEQLYQSLENEMRDLAKHRKHEDPMQSAARMIQVINDTGTLYCTIHGAVGVTKSVKSNLQTLMKNQ